jgi:dTDP-4-dehydrorhamnose 3,5-epimerase
MKIEPTHIKNVFVIKPLVREDERGFFMETHREDILEQAGVSFRCVQANHSLSTKKNTVRGLHFQYDPPMAKIMRVTRGRAFLVAVDIRKGSPTLGKWFGVEASEENKIQLYAPAGFARGFQTLEDMTEIQYLTSGLYNKEGEAEISWLDSEINIDWPIKDSPILSDRSGKAPSLSDWLNRPEADTFFFASE